MQPITNITPAELEASLCEAGETSSRARLQTKTLGKYLYQAMMTTFAELDSVRELSSHFKEELQRKYTIPKLHLKDNLSSCDGTQKFLFALPDGNTMETVLIPDVGKKKGKRALCLSTQVGCAMGCRFCLTGKSGLIRNLETWEIIEQFREVSRQIQEPITHLIFMGMGEPLHNFDNLMKAIAIFTSVAGAKFPETRLTVSTSGLLPQLKRLAQETKVLLALTLSAPQDPLRSEIMPINRKYSLQDLVQMLEEFSPKTRERLFIEYVLLKGVNDQPEHALLLTHLLAQAKCKINLIPFNEIPGFPYQRPEDEATRVFSRILRDNDFRVSTRISRGRDILAACGQLSDQNQNGFVLPSS